MLYLFYLFKCLFKVQRLNEQQSGESSRNEASLPANASRAFLMSSLFRMLLIAILAEEETREEEKDRKGQDKVKNTLARELLMELGDVLVLRWWHS